MSFYLRKSVRVGPFRFNLSKSGIGVSTGIPGFRIGHGPKGNYVHMGRGGLYYRKTLSSDSGNRFSPYSTSRPELYPPAIPSDTYEPLQAIESADVSSMVDSSSKALVEELNAKRKRYRIWPIVVIVSTIAAAIGAEHQVPAWAFYGILIVGVVLSLFTYYKDLLAKTTVILYDFEPETQRRIEDLHAAFAHMRSCRAVWHLEAQGRVHDSKYHAGANSLVQRKKISLDITNPPFVKTNVRTPFIPVGKQTLYFFPDRVLIFEPNGVGAVSYENLEIDFSNQRFIEDETVPSDAQVVDSTWKYVNKKGGADRRFKDNRQFPIALYESVHLWSETGLNEKVMLSATGRTASFLRTIKSLRL